MRAFAHMPLLEVIRYQVHRIAKVEPVHDALIKAERATPQHTLDQLTEPAHPATKLPARRAASRRSEAPLTRVTGRAGPAVLASLEPYREMLEPQRQHLLSLYRPVDVAFKVVGTGSVGLRDYCVYFEGNGPADPLFLQIKEEPASAYAPYLPDAQPRPSQRPARRRGPARHATAVRSLSRLDAHRRPHYLVRQLNDHKGSIQLEDLAGAGLQAYAEICGELLARGHARSGDPLVLAGYLGAGDGFAEALGKFGALYADQTEKDWQQLRKANKQGGKTPTKRPSKAEATAANIP